MLVNKLWQEKTNGGLTTWLCEGWYLFGFIPLLIKRIEMIEEYLTEDENPEQ